jgi:hypothetical protein
LRKSTRLAQEFFEDVLSKDGNVEQLVIVRFLKLCLAAFGRYAFDLSSRFKDYLRSRRECGRPGEHVNPVFALKSHGFRVWFGHNYQITKR